MCRVEALFKPVKTIVIATCLVGVASIIYLEKRNARMMDFTSTDQIQSTFEKCYLQNFNSNPAPFFLCNKLLNSGVWYKTQSGGCYSYSDGLKNQCFAYQKLKLVGMNIEGSFDTFQFYDWYESLPVGRASNAFLFDY